VLAARPFGAGTSELHYQVLGVALQQLWIVGMWALLEVGRVRVRTRALVLIAALVSDITIVHGFFVWPKLVAVGFLLMAAALIFGGCWNTTRRRPGMAVLLASLFALAMLCHGTSVYFVMPLVLFAALHGRPRYSSVVAAVRSAAILYLPWMAYQHYFDPPGDRLLKSQLAAHGEIDNRSVLLMIVDAYAKVGVRKAIDNKITNVNAVTGGAHGIADIARAIAFGGRGQP